MKHLFFHVICLMFLFVFSLTLSGCSRSVHVHAVLTTPELEEIPAATPAPVATPTPSISAKKIDPLSKFIVQETLPPERKQIVNPKKATYKLLGLDKEEKETENQSLAEQWTLPIVSVTTKNGEYILSRTEYLSCIIDVFNCPDKWKIDEASAGIRIRGNSSAYYGDEEKVKSNPVPYRIKFDKKTKMLGLNNGAKCKSWVLLKAEYDIIRNDLALRFGRSIMNGHAFCSDAAFVHVYVNGIYQGIYTLCEQCQVNEYRVSITEPDEAETGINIGFYMVIDNNPEYPRSFTINYGGHRVEDIEGFSRQFLKTAYTLKSDVYTQGQIDFITQYINNVFEIVYQACEKETYLQLDAAYDLIPASYTSVKETICNVLDIDSIVNMYILYELMHDYDVGEGSFYMCVDFSEDSTCSKFQFTSPWDFNWTCKGRTDRFGAGSFSEVSFIGEYGDRTNPWFVLLINLNPV